MLNFSTPSKGIPSTSQNTDFHPCTRYLETHQATNMRRQNIFVMVVLEPRCLVVQGLSPFEILQKIMGNFLFIGSCLGAHV